MPSHTSVTACGQGDRQDEHLKRHSDVRVARVQSVHAQLPGTRPPDAPVLHTSRGMFWCVQSTELTCSLPALSSVCSPSQSSVGRTQRRSDTRECKSRARLSVRASDASTATSHVVTHAQPRRTRTFVLVSLVHRRNSRRLADSEERERRRRVGDHNRVRGGVHELGVVQRREVCLVGGVLGGALVVEVRQEPVTARMMSGVAWCVS